MVRCGPDGPTFAQHYPTINSNGSRKFNRMIKTRLWEEVYKGKERIWDGFNYTIIYVHLVSDKVFMRDFDETQGDFPGNRVTYWMIN